jgi:hypothetical protein
MDKKGLVMDEKGLVMDEKSILWIKTTFHG